MPWNKPTTPRPEGHPGGQRRFTHQNYAPGRRRRPPVERVERPQAPPLLPIASASTAVYLFSCDCGASIQPKGDNDDSDIARFGWTYSAGKYHCPKCQPQLEVRNR